MTEKRISKYVCVGIPLIYLRYTVSPVTVGKVYDISMVYINGNFISGWYNADDGEGYIFRMDELGPYFTPLDNIRNDKLEELGING